MLLYQLQISEIGKRTDASSSQVSEYKTAKLRVHKTNIGNFLFRCEYFVKVYSQYFDVARLSRGLDITSASVMRRINHNLSQETESIIIIIK